MFRVRRLGRAIVAELLRPPGGLFTARTGSRFAAPPLAWMRSLVSVPYPTRTIQSIIPPTRTIDESEPRPPSPGHGRPRPTGSLPAERPNGLLAAVYLVAGVIGAMALGAASVLVRQPPTCVGSELRKDLNLSGPTSEVVCLGTTNDWNKIFDAIIYQGLDPIFDWIVLAHPSAFLGLLVLIPADLYDALVIGELRSRSRSIIPPPLLLIEWHPTQTRDETFEVPRVVPESPCGPSRARQWDAAAARVAQQADYEAIDAGVAMLWRLEKIERLVGKARVSIRAAKRVAQVQALRKKGKRTRKEVGEEQEERLEMERVFAARARGERKVYRGRGGDVVEESDAERFYREWQKTPGGQLAKWCREN